MNKIICIVGPTASGKTKLAVELAKSAQGGPASGWNGSEIISADSRQVYKGLDIGTGKDLNEYGKVKYHLIDICEPEKKFTLFDWLKLARKKIKELHQKNILPIIAGGTGLYVQALVEGFQLAPANFKVQNSTFKSISNDKISKCKSNQYTRKALEKKSLQQLRKIYDRLLTTDNKLDLNNPHRLIRAIEKAQRGLEPTKSKPNFEILQIGITLPRAKLYEKIDRRVDERFAKEKMLEEVAGLLNRGVSIDWLTKLGLEYRIISTYLLDNFKFQSPNFKSISNDKVKNMTEYKQMAQELKNKSHAYARRQLTWFGRFPEIKWVKNSRETELLVRNFLKD